ncbi:MAG: twitch domain-containing radical SAM protein [Firmicutes bacterium]|nr:twitch domain-containing radical SAM protein [Bacillota bacterium]
MHSRELIKELIEKGKHFCVAPWVHLHVTSLGNMNLCCSARVNGKGYGSLNENCFQELWQGEIIRNFRLKLLADEADPRCAQCYQQAKLGLWNLRTEINNLYAYKYLDWVVDTDSEGFSPNAKPVDWDIRFSNICNLKCRSCGYYSSSRWFYEGKVLGRWKFTDSNKAIIKITDSAKLLNDLGPYFSYVDRIQFAGGEPLLMEENYHLLQILDGLNKHDVELSYITNLTKLALKNYDIISFWKKFTKLRIAISLDGLGARCEYLRKGLKWDQVLENWSRLKLECPHSRIHINYTVSAYNIWHLPDFHRWMVEEKYISADEIVLIFLVEPFCYKIKILPPEMKKQVIAKFQNHIQWLKGQTPFYGDDRLESNGRFLQWFDCLQYLNDQDWSHRIPIFVNETRKFDELRHESCVEVFPELEPLFHCYGKMSRSQ